jgi:UDP-glucose 4-epimerase
MRVLVVGGAGYIGSHMVKHLDALGHAVITLDNLSTGFGNAVTVGDIVVGDMADTDLLDALFAHNRFDGVMHFAAFSLVGESAASPAKYYRNNVTNTLNLLDAMRRHGVDRFIFSSTAAVYGEPVATPIAEDHPERPINPYGRSKLMVERVLADYAEAYGLRYVTLRYFNAAGADPDGSLGERHEPETHLVPLVLQAASGRRECISVFGDNYDTPDGTCIRDYIHVTDLCDAHVLALESLTSGGSSGVYNLGNGAGYSVTEVIDTARRVTGKPVPAVVAPPRIGDPARLVADATRASRVLGWRPQRSALDDIIADAWRWEKQKGLRW